MKSSSIWCRRSPNYAIPIIKANWVIFIRRKDDCRKYLDINGIIRDSLFAPDFANRVPQALIYYKDL